MLVHPTSGVLNGCVEEPMSKNASAGLQSPARPAEQLRDTRVTAEIVVDEDGERRTFYRAQGRQFGSLTTLKAALGVVA